MLASMILITTMMMQYSALSPIVQEAQIYASVRESDVWTDTSITRYVGPNDPLNTPRYRPVDLVDLNGAAFARVQWGIGYLRKEAFEQFADMAYHFYQTFKRRLVVVSSFRSYGLQNTLFEGYTESHGLAAAATFSALPGRSEHQLGLSVDLFTANDVDAAGYSGYYDRLRKNAHKWGWIQSYQKWAKVDGYIVEPWHWRYVGKWLATELLVSGMTFSERVDNYKR